MDFTDNEIEVMSAYGQKMMEELSKTFDINCEFIYEKFSDHKTANSTIFSTLGAFVGTVASQLCDDDLSKLITSIIVTSATVKARKKDD